MKVASILVLSILLYVAVDVSLCQNCCQKLKLPNKCHFLCGTREESWLSLTRWTCMHQHGAAVANCKFRSSIDYVKAFGKDFTNTVKDGFNKVSAAVQAKLLDAAKFATTTADELRTVSQDVLSSLATVSQMTASQFKGLISRFTNFTAQNLRSLLEKVNIDVIFQNIHDLGNQIWDVAQAKILASTAYKKYGKDISKWTSAQLSSLGNLIVGIPSSDLAKVAASAFDKSLTSMCKARLKIYQKISLITPATKSFGKISTWTSSQIKEMCTLLEALTPEQLLELSAKEISDAVDGLKNLSFDDAQLDALLAKTKEQFGSISSWTLAQLQNIGKMAKGLSVEDLAKIDKEKIKSMLTDLGKIRWNAAQARKLGEKLKEALGLPEKWDFKNLNAAKNVLKGLVASELERFKGLDLALSLENLKGINWTIDQAQVVLEKIKSKLELNVLSKNSILAMANTIDSWASSDVGKFSQTVLFAAFPELFIVKTIATPVLRQFLRVYRDQPGSKDIGLLGGVAQALTRFELNKAFIADIVQSLEKLTGNDWDEAQIAELMVKVRAKLGELNATETSHADLPSWGAANLKKLGKVVLGLTKDELKRFPIRGIEDSVEVMGKNSGWRRGQVVSFIARFREYMEMQEKTIENLDELDIEALGSLVQGFATKELKKLPNSALNVAIKKIGEQTGLPEDKLKSHAFMAVEHFKKTTGYDVLDTNQVKSLGNLVVGLSRKALSKLSRNAFLSEAYNVASKPGMSEDKLKELVSLGKKYYGQSDVGKWISGHWKKLGPAIKTMDAGEILRINKDAFDGMIDYFGEMDGWSTDQAKALVLKAKEFWKEHDVSKWTGAQLKRLGSLIKGLSKEEILKITKKSFKDMIGSCAHFKTLDGDALKALATRAKQVLVNGDASKFRIIELKQLGCAVTGLDLDDLKKLNLDIDVVAELGKHAGWSPDQLKVLADKLKTFLNEKPDKENFMSAGNLAKGLTPVDIKKLSAEAFKYAAGKIGKMESLSQEQTKEFANKAKESWDNDVSKWSVAQIIEAGNLISGMSPEDIPKMDKNAIDAIKVSALKMMSKDQIKAFSVEQIKSMDSQQVYSLTKEQKSGFSTAQFDAMVSIERQDPVDPDPWSCKGTCSSGTKLQMTSVLPVLISLFAMLLWTQW